MPNPTPNPEPRRARFVRVAKCFKSVFSKPDGRHVMAGILFTDGAVLLEPFYLNPLQANVLARDLIQVLHAIENPDDESSGSMVSEVLSSPPIPAPPLSKADKKKLVRPSRRASLPKGPIPITELRQLRSMVQNVKSHDDFMKFIGADAAEADPSAAAKANAPVVAPIQRRLGEKPVKPPGAVRPFTKKKPPRKQK